MEKQKLSATFRAAAVGTTALLTAAAQLQSQTAVTPANASVTTKAPSIYDKIWGYAEFYHNEDNPVIQSFKFTGRFQLDYVLVDADQGQHDEWNIRRFRLGGKAKLFQDFTFHGEVDLNPQEPYPVYQRLTDMYLAWSRSKDFVVTAGKQSAGFTMDGMTSSKELLTIDRGNLANNLWFPEEYIPGVTVSGKPGHWVYQAGVYSSGAANEEFGEFNGGVFFLGTLGYDFGKVLNVKQAVLAGNYVYNDPDANNTFTRNLQHVGSLNFSFDTGKWGFRSDLSGGVGYLGQSDLWGAMLMPFYNITDKFQVVGRYTFLTSENNNGVRLATYEKLVVPGRGDEYNEFYVGLNYYFYKHKLKLQTGVQYAEMHDRANDGGDYSGWAWTTGLRIGW
jgi:phosphate-selective porin OprO/OprP